VSITKELVYPLKESPSFGQPIEITEGIFWLRVPIPFALDHINLWLLRDGDGWTIVDTGFFSSNVKKIWQQLQENFFKNDPVKKIIVTHFHPDHVGMASWLMEQTGAELWMSEREFLTIHRVCHPYSDKEIATRTRFYKKFGFDGEQITSVINSRSSDTKGLPEPPDSYHRMCDGNTISINGEDWFLSSFSGHSPEHICLYNAKRKLLISGDQVLPTISPNISVMFFEPLANPLAEYLDSLIKLAELDEETLVLPSHGKVFLGLHYRIDQLTKGHQESLRMLIEYCHQPRSGKQLMEKMFGSRLSAFNLSLGAGEALAHINHLVARNELKKSNDFITHYDH